MLSTYNAHLHTHHSPHIKKTAIKTAPSAPSSRAAPAPKIILKSAKAAKKAKEEEEEVFEDDDDDDDDDDMGTSFLQFCAMCEKQIVVPNSSILYCSESCRRRDATTSATQPYCFETLRSPTKLTSFYDDTGPQGAKLPTYIPALRPTPRTIPDGRIPAKFHESKSDLDPTEWKPAEPNLTEGKSPTKSGEWKPKLAHRPSSEAASYLSKFHTSSDSLTSKRRPTTGHSRTVVSSRSIPGLSHTPTASTSSDESLSGTPYEFVARPALGMPAASTIKTSSGIKIGNELTYEKKHVRTSLGSASGSLKKLLGNAAEGM